MTHDDFVAAMKCECRTVWGGYLLQRQSGADADGYRRTYDELTGSLIDEAPCDEAGNTHGTYRQLRRP